MLWEIALLREARKIIQLGGEVRFIVEKRGDGRVPLILSYPNNKIRCDEIKIFSED